MAADHKLRSIGFDLPDEPSARRASGTASPVARVLAALQAEIDRHGAAARHLHTVTFNTKDGSARVALREHPLATDYPSLGAVFREIARACAQGRVSAGQLRCIMFEEDEIRLLLVNAWGQPEAYVFPVPPLARHEGNR
jgi:hypothetical protein